MVICASSKNKFCVILSHPARSIANSVSKNGNFQPVFRTIVLKVQDDRQCVKWESPMQAVLLPWRLGYQMIANGCSMRRPSHGGAMWWSVSR